MSSELPKFQPRLHRPEGDVEAAPSASDTSLNATGSLIDAEEFAEFDALAARLSHDADRLSAMYPARRDGMSTRLIKPQPSRRKVGWPVGVAAAVLLVGGGVWLAMPRGAGESDRSVAAGSAGRTESVDVRRSAPALIVAAREESRRPTEARPVSLERRDAPHVEMLMRMDPAVREAMFDLEAAGEIRAEIDI
jgi:hypothetical protein